MLKPKTKIMIGVVYGGPSSEHEVSLSTAAQVQKHLDRNKYQVTPIKISRTGNWPRGFEPSKLKQKIDLAFLALHGEFGEDGTIQGLLDSYQVPYTFSGMLASALAMDKYRSGKLAEAHGFRIPATILVKKNSKGIKFPSGKTLVAKPNAKGSSVGVNIIERAKVKRAVDSLHKTNDDVLVQSYIPGREVTVSVIGNHIAKALPVIEILSKGKFFDYKSKYEAGQSTHLIPAPLPRNISRGLQKAAESMHQLLGCRGVSRSDFIVAKNGSIYYLETNTIPGMTPTSLLPDAARVHGLSFSQLLDEIIRLATL